MNHILSFLFILASLFAALFVKKHNVVIGIIIAFTAAIIVISESLVEFEGVIVKLNGFTVDSDIFRVPLKALGITLISKILVSVCDDAGEKLLSFTVGFVTKISIMLLTLPIVEEILDMLINITTGN